MNKLGTIYITKQDFERLKMLIAETMIKDPGQQKYLHQLSTELDQAEVCDQKNIPEDVITMNSKIHLRDLDSSEEVIYTLVYPVHANIDLGQVSILAPIGTGMIGYRVGDVIEWPVPGGTRRLEVKGVLYQPEASGEFLQ